MKLRAPALAVVAALALTGCDQSPSLAARVGSQEIPVSDVQLLTRALCTPTPGAPTAGNAVATVNDAAVATLVEAAVDQQIAQARGVTVDPTQLAAQLGQFDKLIAALPAEDRDRASTLIEDIFRGRAAITQIAQQSIGTGASQAANGQALQQAVQKLEKSYAAKVGVQLNPRYDSAGLGSQGTGSQSVSVPVSDAATKGAAAAGGGKPDATWLGDLPANLRCG
ncbi:MAG: hypothetical protein ACTHNS_01855 [Marmoricola sp.]